MDSGEEVRERGRAVAGEGPERAAVGYVLGGKKVSGGKGVVDRGRQFQSAAFHGVHRMASCSFLVPL